MSRLLNIDLPEAEVEKACAAHNVAISAIEPLPSGGTHLVCILPEGADTMRQVFEKKLIAGIVRRFPFYRARGPW
ncbi:hypothetical protein [Novosphingobium sp. 9]|uniref:hypothetical protein n=1 Tax=Novosphingobium sp. 9 TaxID=2025349 RepID=UPI0021B5AEC7|nr:hypothetical protein [Novosphingobium sp. 9]